MSRAIIIFPYTTLIVFNQITADYNNETKSFTLDLGGLRATGLRLTVLNYTDEPCLRMDVAGDALPGNYCLSFVDTLLLSQDGRCWGRVAR